MRITVPAPAKVNLWLRIGQRQPSGFHDLDTLFCALELADTVMLHGAAPGSGIRLESGFAPPLDALPDLGPDSRNLVVRAAAAFFERGRLPADTLIRLVKRIPAAGGLGGGSSDAAAVLRGLARLFPDAVHPAALRQIAADLGSDVPFFVAGHPLSRGLGRGVDLLPASAPPPRDVLLALPPLAIATGDAYRWLDDARESGLGPPPPPVRTTPIPDRPAWDYMEKQASNDFEPALFHRFPILRRLRDTMRHHGARPALLAGSGSTVFGVFREERDARAAATDIQAHDPTVRTVMTRTRSR